VGRSTRGYWREIRHPFGRARWEKGAVTVPAPISLSPMALEWEGKRKMRTAFLQRACKRKTSESRVNRDGPARINDQASGSCPQCSRWWALYFPFLHRNLRVSLSLANPRFSNGSIRCEEREYQKLHRLGMKWSPRLRLESKIICLAYDCHFSSDDWRGIRGEPRSFYARYRSVIICGFVDTSDKSVTDCLPRGNICPTRKNI